MSNCKNSQRNSFSYQKHQPMSWQTIGNICQNIKEMLLAVPINKILYSLQYPEQKFTSHSFHVAPWNFPKICRQQKSQEICVSHHCLGILPVLFFVTSHYKNTVQNNLHLLRGCCKGPGKQVKETVEVKKGDKAHNTKHGYCLLREALQYRGLYIRQGTTVEKTSQTINYLLFKSSEPILVFRQFDPQNTKVFQQWKD